MALLHGTIFIFIFLFPLILPIIVVFSGLNIAKTDKSPSNRVAKSILSETRELYFRMPFRNTIQFDNDCFELSRTLVYQPKKNASCLQNNFEFNQSINQVIFIGLASLTFPHILLEYLIEKDAK